MSQREAYRGAYSCEKSSDKTVDNKASALLRNGEIKARYDELVELSQPKMLYSELNELRKELNDKLDGISDKINCEADSRMTRKELELSIEPMQQRIELLEHIMWLVGSASVLALLNAIFHLISL